MAPKPKPKPKSKPNEIDPFKTDSQKEGKESLRAKLPSRAVFDFAVNPRSNLSESSPKQPKSDNKKRIETYFNRMNASSKKTNTKKTNFNDV